MPNTISPDLAVTGPGAGGLGVAAGAAQTGASVVPFERGKMGGDCLDYGCVPSKSLLTAARSAHAVRSGGRFGVNGHEPYSTVPGSEAPARTGPLSRVAA